MGRAVGWAGGLVLLAALTLSAQVQAPMTATPVGAAFGNFWAYAGAFATAGILGAVKKMDVAVTQAPLFRKLQPVLTLAGSFGLAAIASHGGPSLDPSTLTTAPMATVAAVVFSELFGMFQRSVTMPKL